MARTKAPPVVSTLTVEQWPVDKPTPYAANPRKNSGAVAKVVASLREYGFRQPIVVDEAGVVIAGHTRLLAAKSMGLETVPVHVATGLTPEQVRAYRIADNRTAEEAEWDDALLVEELVALQEVDFDLALTGLDSDEIADLLAGAPVVTAEEADQQEVPDPPADPITKPGDRIILGNHVLVCGDATDAGAWETLMAGESADAVWTDPPYGVSYGEKNAMLNRVAQKGSRSGWSLIETPIDNDSLTADGLRDFLAASLGLAWAACRAGAAWYVAAPGSAHQHAFGIVLNDLGVWRQTLQWVKNGMVIGRSDYHGKHETIFYGWKQGAGHSWYGDRSQTTVLEFAKPRANDLHPTMKPIALIAYCLGNSAKAGDIVCDPFSGSGSTLIACETANLKARCLELSPAYCDVIVTRWETATGKTAVRP